MSINRSPSSKPLEFLDLPTEVRREIYKHLFCHKPSPISFASKQYQPLSSTWATDEEPAEPTFHTSIFRVNKAISHDALHLAYSANSFLLTGDVLGFCGLGSIALASIKSLTVFNNGWQPGEESRKIWHTLNHRCPDLELLVVEPSSHILVQAIPYLKDFLNAVPPGQRRPRLLLDLYVWDRHFSFDFPDRDYRQAMQALNKRPSPDAWEGFLKPKQVVMSMPKHVEQIDLVADVSPGFVRALDKLSKEDPEQRFVKMSGRVPRGASQRVGRQTRICYVWESSD